MADQQTPAIPLTMGKAIRKARRAAKLTQIAVAEAVGVEQGTVSQWEADQHRPSIDRLLSLADLLNCHPSELLPAEFDPDNTLARLAPAQHWHDETYTEARALIDRLFQLDAHTARETLAVIETMVSMAERRSATPERKESAA